MQNKYIFVDVDGVMHNAFELIDKTQLFEKECMLCLKEIVEKTGAKLVLSSSWRASEATAKTVQLHLKEYGLEYIDKIPLTSDRPVDIRKWLNEHDPNANFIVLDDWDMSEEFGDRMVCTTLRSKESGLRKFHVKICIKKLGENKAK